MTKIFRAKYSQGIAKVADINVEMHMIKGQDGPESFKLKNGIDTIFMVSKDQMQLVVVDQPSKSLVIKFEVDEPAKKITFESDLDLIAFVGNFELLDAQLRNPSFGSEEQKDPSNR